MVRTKLSLQLIDDTRRRHVTFKKRMSGLKRKAMELATLCDVPTLLVCFAPEGQIDVWPEDPREARAVADRLLSASAEDRSKHRYDVSSFFGDQVMERAVEQGGRVGSRGPRCSTEEGQERLPGGSSEASLQELERALEGRLRAIEERIGVLLRGEASLQRGQQGDEGGWQRDEQGQLQCHLLETNPGAVGLGCGQLEGEGDAPHPPAVFSGFYQNLLHGPPLMMHAAPTACASTSLAAPCLLQTHGTDVGTSVLGASPYCNPSLPACALDGNLYQHDGCGALSYGNAPTVGHLAPAGAMETALLPPGPGVFLGYDVDGACGSAMCGKCCTSRSPGVMAGDDVLLGGSGGCSGGAGGAREQVASSSSTTGDAVHRRGELHGDGFGH